MYSSAVSFWLVENVIEFSDGSFWLVENVTEFSDGPTLFVLFRPPVRYRYCNLVTK
jgi:hypothetical protein